MVLDNTDLKSLENKFLEAIEAEPPAVPALLDMLSALIGAGATETARASADLLQSTLVERGDAEALLTLFLRTADAFDRDPTYAASVYRALRRLFTAREAVAFLEVSGLGKPPTPAALRRFQRLLKMKPGDRCLDRHWGFGVVRSLDAFQGRLMVDFAERPNHAIPFAHAADTLEWVDAQHLLSRRHADPEAFNAWRREHPDELVRLAVRDFGSLSVTRLETVLVQHGLLGAENWKSFWDRARKALKADPGVEIPARRTEPIRFHDLTDRYGERWFAALAAERDAGVLYQKISEWAGEEGDPEQLEASCRKLLEERLAFAVAATERTDPVLLARLTLLVAKVWPNGVDLAALARRYNDLDSLQRVGSRLSVRDAEALTRLLMDADVSMARMLVYALHRLPYAMLGPAIDWAENSAELAGICDVALRERLHARDTSPTLLVWALRHRGRVRERGLIEAADLLTHAVAALDTPLNGEGLRMQNTVRQYFSSGSDLEPALREMSALQRELLFNRLQVSSGWDSVDQRGVLARLVKAFPELGLLAARASAAASEPETATRLTSWRSYLERRAQLKQLIEVDIPGNSREIGQARAYGDLRENFEYHAARHQQGLLMQRRADLERDLEQVRGADFRDSQLESAGRGVTVVLASPDGAEKRFTILGEWDRDAELNIISSESRVAQVLQGHVPGDPVELPDGEGRAVAMQIKAIEPLSAAVRDWIGTESQAR